MSREQRFSSRPIETTSPVLRAIFGVIESRGTPMEHVARDMETTPNQLWQWRAGRTTPRLDKVERLCEVLGIDVDIFVPEDHA